MLLNAGADYLSAPVTYLFFQRMQKMYKIISDDQATISMISDERTIIFGLGTVLLSKRVNNYQCMFIADFSGETCMYPDLTWYPVRSMDGLSTSPVVG